MNPPPGAWRVLVVDDEPNIRSAIVRALNLLGYHADGAESGRAALEQLTRGDYALMLLDILMPGMSGTEVMRQVRAGGSDVAIIILTGNATLDSAVAAVKAGAQDYLIKPASIETIAQAVAGVLQKRGEEWRHRQLVRTALHALQAAENRVSDPTPSAAPTRGDESTTSPSSGEILRVGRLRLHSGKRLAEIDEDSKPPVELTEGEARVLRILMQHPDQVLSCHELVKTAWDYDLEEEEARSLIRHYIFRLRQKIEPKPNEPHWIHTVRERGYMLGEMA